MSKSTDTSPDEDPAAPFRRLAEHAEENGDEASARLNRRLAQLMSEVNS